MMSLLSWRKIEDARLRRDAIKQQAITLENIYKIMVNFDCVYNIINDEEKRNVVTALIKEIEIYRNDESEYPLKRIGLNFPVFKDGGEVTELLWDKGNTVETVVLLSRKKPDGHINVKVEFGEGEGKVPLDNIAKRAEEYKPKERVTYKMIKEYIEAKYGFKVHTAYIAEVKRDLGLPMYDAPNAVEELKQPRKHPTAEKVEAIKDALRYFEIMEEI